MPGTRRVKGHPDREINNIFATLNEQQSEKHDIAGLYEGRLRSHAQNFEGLKRKWEGFTGVPVPKKLRTSEPYCDASVESNQTSATEQLNQKPAAAKTVRKPQTTSTAVVPVKAAGGVPAMPSHPDDKLDIDDMKVNELRKELKKRQLSTTGRKAELQARLREYVAENKKKREADWAAKHAVKEAETQIKKVKISEDTSKTNVDQMDVVMEDANEEEVEIVEPVKTVAPVAKPSPAKKMAPVTKPSPAKSMAMSNYQSAITKQAPKSALKPSKYSSAMAQGTPQRDDVVKPAAKPAPSSIAKEDLAAPKQMLPTKVSDSSIESSTPAISTKPTATGKSTTTLQSSVQKAKISTTLAQTTPGGSAFKTKSGGGESAKLLDKKKQHQAASEARKARLAEMRQKAAGGSATKQPPSHSKFSSSLKKMASNSTVGESKPNSILAQMREKAAAGENTKNGVPSLPTKPSSAVKPTAMKHPGLPKASPSMKPTTQLTTSHSGLKPTALKSILDPANKPSPVPEIESATKPVPAAIKPEVKPLSPMQTYEMSDREEESDSESESDDEYERQKPKKAIPAWAQKSNLMKALERQFAEGPDRLDPDKIFGEVLTCNLEEIFDKKKSRYQRRTSSGNWTKDHVTLAEKLTYKRTMGYDHK